MMNKVVFGIDVGGTTIKCGFFSDDGELIEKEELPTRKENSGENILPDIAEYIKMTLAMHKKKFTDIAGIGIGVPGAVRDDGTVNKCVNLGWDVVNVPNKLSELLIFPKEKIKAGNDANVAALGEYWKGSGKEYSSIMMVTIGTGVGGGLILDGKPINGFNGAAAEIGHMPLVDGLDFACNCGKTGCLEQVASATGIARLAGTKNAKEVLELTLYNREEDKIKIPEPTPLEKIKCKENEKTVAISVWMPLVRNEMEEQSVKKTLTIPCWLNKLAEEQNINFSKLLQSALKEYLKIKRVL